MQLIDFQYIFAQPRQEFDEKAGFDPKGTTGSSFIPFSINISSLKGSLEFFALKGHNMIARGK